MKEAHAANIDFGIEYSEFCKRIENKHSNSKIWNEGKGYLKEDTIITIKYPSCEKPGTEIKLDVKMS